MKDKAAIALSAAVGLFVYAATQDERIRDTFTELSQDTWVDEGQGMRRFTEWLQGRYDEWKRRDPDA